MLKTINLLSSTAILSDTVAEIFDAASNKKIIKISQYSQLTEALTQSLERQDREAIERLFRWVQAGRIQLINDRTDSAIAKKLDFHKFSLVS